MLENKIFQTIKKSVFYFYLFLISFMFIIIKCGADLDLWHRLAVGKIFFETGWVLNHDIFSYFPKKEMWIDHEWLSGVIFYFLGHYFGDYGILALSILITFSILFMIYKINMLILPENKSRISYYTLVLISLLPGLTSVIRCQAFTYLFFTLWIYLLEKIRRGEKRFIWIFPATAILWANMHAGFLAGIGLLIFYIVGDLLNKRKIKYYLLILALVIPLTLINPYGIKFWSYLFHAVTMDRPYISEWEAFNPFKEFYKGLGFKILSAFLILGYGFKIFSKDYKFDKVEIIFLLVTLFMTFKHERHVMFFSIGASCYGYKNFVLFLDFIFKKFLINFEKIDQEIKEKIIFAKEYAIYFFLYLTIIYIIITSKIQMGMWYYPVKAIEFIKINNISGNLLIPFNWASYSLWKLYPQCYVSVDGRYEEIFKEQSYLDICRFSFVEKGWQNILDKYHHDIIILDIKSEIFKKLKTIKKWDIVYQDKQSAVFLPANKFNKSWKAPNPDENYYVITKYDNRIEF